jgi:hypothetical protein
MITIDGLFVEQANIVPFFMPANLASGAQTGDVISLKNYKKCVIVFLCGAGASSQDPTITVLQATSVAPSNAKALNFTRVDQKQATALTSVGTFTTVTQAAANTYTNDTSGEAQKLWVIEIDSSDLDVAGGYDCVQVTMADPGTNSQIGTCFAILYGSRYQPPLSAIAN